MLKDIFGQAIEAMRHNGRRTMITIVGMAWGIATVVLLLAYGAGFGQAFENIFAQLYGHDRRLPRRSTGGRMSV